MTGGRFASGATSVRQGEDLDWPAVEAYLRSQLPDLSGDFEVLQFPNGSANLTYLVRFGEQRLVLRRPPFGRLAPGAHDMEREHRVLSRLWQGFPPAPRALLFCADETIVGAKFFLMDYRDGVVIWDAIPEPMRYHPDVAHRVSMAVVQVLADLHRVDYEACGLGDLGRPDGFVGRQVRGWLRRWELVAPESGLRVMEEAAALLAAHQPKPQRASLLHNDFKLDNCQFRPDQPDRVHSVFDWDMATAGDPLVDLGTLLNYWPDPSDAPGNRGFYNDGMDLMGLATHAQLIDTYADATGLDLEGVRWYWAFACWKLGVALQQLYDRYRRGETTDERMADRGQRVAEMGERALGLLQSGESL